MISLTPGSLCDVCAEEYGPHNSPHSIPCGHILCLDCCNNILQKTSPRLTPCCPFCREVFTSDAIRLIRIDFGAAALASPKRGTVEAHEPLRDESDDDVLLFNPGTLKSRNDVRRLEYKVAKVAGKKCSVEEVTSLHKELQEWLNTDTKHDEQASSLHLSAALLRAILVNHLAHSEATKLAKSVEAHLKKQLDDSESERRALESELHKTRAQLQAAQQEVQSTRAQTNRTTVRAAAPTLQVPAKPASAGTLSGLQSGLVSPPRPPSTNYFSSSASSGSRSGATSPTSPTRTTYTPSPLARAAVPALHARSASVAPHIRSMTPARSATPAHHSTPEPTPTKSQRLSSPPPPMPYSAKMMRSSSGSSDEKERDQHAARMQLLQRWTPSANAMSASPPSSKPDHFAPMYRSASVLPRRKTPAPVHY